jgi:hypothetical protein
MSKKDIILGTLIVLGLAALILFGYFSGYTIALGLGIILGAFFLTYGLGILVYRGYTSLNLPTQAIILGILFLLLAVLLFVQPEISIFVGASFIVLPPIVAVVYFANHGFTLGEPGPLEKQRLQEKAGRAAEPGGGCLLITACPIGGILLLFLSWLFQRDAFNAFLRLF